MNNRKVLTELLRRLTIQIEGNKIPMLNRYTEKIELNCHEGCIGDIKQIMRLKGGEESG